MYTKEQLEGMIDFDINKIMVEVTHKKTLTGTQPEIKGNTSVTVYGLMYSIKVDYCNNWADMGPLLKPNNISIAYEKCDTPCAMVVGDATDYIGWEFDIQCFHENELRAAAIVYILVMQGGE